jgi:hypothetical protein
MRYNVNIPTIERDIIIIMPEMGDGIGVDRRVVEYPLHYTSRLKFREHMTLVTGTFANVEARKPAVLTNNMPE